MRRGSKQKSTVPAGAATIYVKAGELKKVCIRAFVSTGVPKRDAEVAADCLVDANLRGIDSHGVIRLAKYIRGLQKGSVNPRPRLKVKHSAPAVVQVDGDNGLGAVAAARAMQELIPLCRRTGVAAAGVRSSNHYGTISYYLLKAASRGLMGIGFVHGESLQVPFGGMQPFFGTNPLAFVFPARRHPIVIDFATSATTFGKIMQARALGRVLSGNEVLDALGNPTTDAQRASRILPAAAHKGYGLALAVEVLSAILNGSPFGPHVPPVFRDDIDAPGRLGHLFVVLDPRRFPGAKTFIGQTEKMIRELHRSKPAPGAKGVLVPGEPEERTKTSRSRSGIPLPLDLWNKIQQVAGS